MMKIIIKITKNENEKKNIVKKTTTNITITTKNNYKSKEQNRKKEIKNGIRRWVFWKKSKNYERF